MKKAFILALCFILTFTNISFVNADEISDSIKNIDEANNRIHIIIKNFVSEEEIDAENIKKEIKFSESILAQEAKRISELYSSESDLEMRKSISSLLHIIALYDLSLKSITVYHDDNSKTEYFIEGCSAFQQGNIALNNVKINFIK